jgi:hypothetical protein
MAEISVWQGQWGSGRCGNAPLEERICRKSLCGRGGAALGDEERSSPIFELAGLNQVVGLVYGRNTLFCKVSK